MELGGGGNSTMYTYEDDCALSSNPIKRWRHQFGVFYNLGIEIYTYLVPSHSSSFTMFAVKGTLLPRSYAFNMPKFLWSHSPQVVTFAIPWTVKWQPFSSLYHHGAFIFIIFLTTINLGLNVVDGLLHCHLKNKK